jgi:hypothetical protein
MEVFAISFLVFTAVSVALAIGLLMGHGPMHGGCRPDGPKGSCAAKSGCSSICAKRREQQATREN